MGSWFRVGMVLGFSLAGAGCTAPSDGDDTGASTSGTESSGSMESSGSDGGQSSMSSAPSDSSTSAGSSDGSTVDGTASHTAGGDTAGGPCINDMVMLENVSFEITTNRVQGEDVPASFDPSQGSFACAEVSEHLATLMVEYGPFELDGLQSRLSVRLHDGARTYDLATDPGPPGSGDFGNIEFGYAYDFEPASTIEYGTKNQAATGTVDVLALPIEGGLTLELTAAGHIAAPDGWEFDFHFTGTVPR